MQAKSLTCEKHYGRLIAKIGVFEQGNGGVCNMILECSPPAEENRQAVGDMICQFFLIILIILRSLWYFLQRWRLHPRKTSHKTLTK